MRTWSWLALTLFIAPLARADILFVDTDASYNETQAVLKAAQERGEKLILVPPGITDYSQVAPQGGFGNRTADQEKAYRQLEEGDAAAFSAMYIGNEHFTAWARLNAQLQEEQKKPANEQNLSTIAQLQKSMQAEQTTMHDLVALVQGQRPITGDYSLPGGGVVKEAELQKRHAAWAAGEKAVQDVVHSPSFVGMSPSEIESTLAAYQRAGKTIDSVIFSGHHDATNSFYGAMGTIHLSDVQSIFATHPTVRSGVRSVEEWGCYSTTTDGCEWAQKAFPDAMITGGFDYAGALKTAAADPEYLESLLVREKALTDDVEKATTADKQSAAVKNLVAAIRALPGFTDTNASVCAGARWRVSNFDGLIDMKTLYSDCTPEALAQLQQVQTRYEALKNGTSNEGIPCDSQNSWLRDYYSSVQRYSHCSKAPDIGQHFAPIVNESANIIRLIDFPAIYDNFVKYYGPKIKALISALDQQKIPHPNLLASVSCESQPGLKRKELMNFLRALSVADDSMYGFGFGPLYDFFMIPEPVREIITQMDATFKAEVGNLECIPLAWVDDNPTPGMTVTPPACYR